MKFYAIFVSYKDGKCFLSQEGYKTLKDAQEFCMDRLSEENKQKRLQDYKDGKLRIEEFNYIFDNGNECYNIKEVTIVDKLIKAYNKFLDIKKEYNMKEERTKKVKKPKKEICSICHTPYVGYGNNAQPINSGRCCDGCNYNYVIPARLANINRKEEK